MATDASGRTDTGERRSRSGSRPWLPVAAAALALLFASEAVWLWQTWPLRELLSVVPPAGSSASPG